MLYILTHRDLVKQKLSIMKKSILIASGIIILFLGTAVTIFALKMNKANSNDDQSRTVVTVTVQQAPDCYQPDNCTCYVNLYHPVTQAVIGQTLYNNGPGTYYVYFDNSTYHLTSVQAGVYCGTGSCTITSTKGTAYSPNWTCSCGACQ